MHAQRLSDDEVRLLARTAHALLMSDGDRCEALRFLECAAAAGDCESQLRLGLILARMDSDCRRGDGAIGAINAADYKEAIRWLSAAGAQGSGRAWHAIACIYRKAEFSQRSLAQARLYLERAAECGERAAQYEFGAFLWRTRKGDAENEVRAACWLQRAALQECDRARALLGKIATRAAPAEWAQALLRQCERRERKPPPALSARLMLAAHFGLSIPEALLIDLPCADRGYCLLVDIRAHYARSRRRLILIEGEDERRVLDRIAHALKECSAQASEGRYRQRLYRLRKLASDWEEVRRLQATENTSAKHAPYTATPDAGRVRSGP